MAPLIKTSVGSRYRIEKAAVGNRVPAWCPKCREWRYFDRERLTRGQKRLPV